MVVRISATTVLLAAFGCLWVPSMANLAAAPAATEARAVSAPSQVNCPPHYAVAGTTVRPSATDDARTDGNPVRSSALPELPGLLALATAVTALAGILNRRKR